MTIMRRIHIRRRRVMLQRPGKLLYVAMLTALGAGACSSTTEPTSDGRHEGGPARDTADASFGDAIAPAHDATFGAPNDGPGGPSRAPLDAGFDAAAIDASDPASNGATITFQSIGAAGWFPSRRDPAA